MTLDNKISIITGVGDKTASVLLKELNISTIEDFISYYPYKYVDRTRVYNINEIFNIGDSSIQVVGRLSNIKKVGEFKKERLVATLYDSTAQVELVWFQKIKFVEQKLKEGQEYLVFGKPTRFNNRLNIVHPDIEVVTDYNMQKMQNLHAFYNTTELMKKRYISSEKIRNIMYYLFNETQLDIEETLPLEIMRRYNFLSRYESFEQIHFPTDQSSLDRAIARFKFEELFYIQLDLLFKSSVRRDRYRGMVMPHVGEKFNNFYRNYIPFDLTSAQKRVVHEIFDDMRSGVQMNRLLQGDVGSGKTMVALMVSLLAVDNSYQACVVAPTEILAQQHFESITQQTNGLGLRVGLLTGSVIGKTRSNLLNDLIDGNIDILVGTHAILEDNVLFKNLGLAVIDEQHRFGVQQRSKLWQKNVTPPHILVMTATPIPRTLAMTVYGDLDVSVIDELPPGRKEVSTYHYYDDKRSDLYGFLRKQIEQGRQVYIVYPLIEQNEKLDFKNLEEGYESIVNTFKEYKVVMVHGRLKPAEKEAAMQEFASNRAQIMVATTVIEVGVNVPNASVMVIESAERFGLSQLHQLRGRVGRGAAKSFCILMSKKELSNDTRRRLQIMCNTTDGFVIAEADMELRGPGNIEGTQQSGMPFDLKIANIALDGRILQTAREEAKEIIEADKDLKQPENQIFVKRLAQLQKSNINWGAIS